VAVAVLFIVASAHFSHANDPGTRTLAQMVLESDLIIVVKLTPSGEKLDIAIEEVLHGTQPPGLSLLNKASFDKESKGREPLGYVFAREASVRFDELASSPRRLFFLRSKKDEPLQPFHQLRAR
jgi:hypothetical protein